MKIALDLQTPWDMRGLLQSVLTSQVSQGFRSEVMTFQKEKTLPFVGYFLLLSKKSWKLSIYEHVESIPTAVP